ncbi:MAG: Uma2 family endonuclease [Kamptonema sp. SIO4C4]|nr:Uma2 family endonuclease [Kamptonema sp. SIO4C4]
MTTPLETPTPPTNLIFDDGEPLESNRHRIAMNVLIESINQEFAHRNDFFAGGNMFIYYSREQAKNRDFRGPDFFVVLDIDGSYPRQGWVVWDEAGRYPDVIVELMSPSTLQTDLTRKKDLYERTFRTADYFVYDPFNPNSLQGWHLGATQRYRQLQPNEQGQLWCESLGLWLGVWEGTIQRETAPWLRFYNPTGQLILLSAEAERQQTEQERQRAEQAEQARDTERIARQNAISRLRERGMTVEEVADILSLSVEAVQQETPER